MASTNSLKSEVSAAISRARAITDGLFRHVKPGAWFDRPIPERHRLIFYVGHLEAFDWNQVGVGRRGLPPVDRFLDELFAFGIDPPSGELPQDKVGDWPGIAKTREYVSSVRQNVDRVLDDLAEDAFHIILEHRLMHAETLTYILHNLPYERRIIPPWRAILNAAPADRRMIDVPEGPATLGRERHEGFGWDNECEKFTCNVPAFRIAKHKVTNGQYLEFVKQGGAVPHYWRKRGAEWFYHGFAEELPLPAEWPVYVTQNQATAYAQWLGKVLPSEEQFHRAAFSGLDEMGRKYPWGSGEPTVSRGNFNFVHRDLIPVNATPQGDSAFGVSQLVGNGWEWTRTLFHPFPGFKPFPTYPGYSADFFDSDHYVLKGASCATDTRLVRSTFRNWFRQHYPYAYTTFRIVEE